MTSHTLILTLGKGGTVTSRVACLPSYAIPGVEITAGQCAGADSHALRRRAALWMLMAARKRRARGIVGYAVVACQATPELGKRLYFADYCFKIPRGGLTSGSTLGMNWDRLVSHLSLVAPQVKARPRRVRKRA